MTKAASVLFSAVFLFAGLRPACSQDAPVKEDWEQLPDTPEWQDLKKELREEAAARKRKESEERKRVPARLGAKHGTVNESGVVGPSLSCWTTPDHPIELEDLNGADLWQIASVQPAKAWITAKAWIGQRPVTLELRRANWPDDTPSAQVVLPRSRLLPLLTAHGLAAPEDLVGKSFRSNEEEPTFALDACSYQLANGKRPPPVSEEMHEIYRQYAKSLLDSLEKSELENPDFAAFSLKNVSLAFAEAFESNTRKIKAGWLKEMQGLLAELANDEKLRLKVTGPSQGPGTDLALSEYKEEFGIVTRMEMDFLQTLFFWPYGQAPLGTPTFKRSIPKEFIFDMAAKSLAKLEEPKFSGIKQEDLKKAWESILIRDADGRQAIDEDWLEYFRGRIEEFSEKKVHLIWGKTGSGLPVAQPLTLRVGNHWVHDGLEGGVPTYGFGRKKAEFVFILSMLDEPIKFSTRFETEQTAAELSNPSEKR